MRALSIALALGGCGVVGRDCSLPARLEAHASERAEFRQALGPLVFRSPCPSTIPEVLVPEENRVDGYKRRLLERMSRSELGADVADAERRAYEASRNASVDCVGFRWSGEEAVREGREILEREERELSAIEARFEDLARRVAEC